MIKQLVSEANQVNLMPYMVFTQTEMRNIADALPTTLKVSNDPRDARTHNPDHSPRV